MAHQYCTSIQHRPRLAPMQGQQSHSGRTPKTSVGVRPYPDTPAELRPYPNTPALLRQFSETPADMLATTR